MKINILSDYIKFNKIFGVNGAMTAAINQAEALKKYGEITINGDESCDIVNSHGCLPYTYYKMIKLKNKGKPIVISAHQTHYDTNNAVKLSGLITPIAKEFLKRYYSKGDLLIVPTENSKRIVQQELCNNVKIKIIRNGIKTDKFKFDKNKRNEFRQVLRLKNDFTVISVGMPIKRKGFDTFRMLSQRLDKNKFIWVGKPGFPLFQDNYKSKINNLIMTGFVNDLSLAYSGADVFCFPSRYEGQGLVILEAASCGLPIIVRDIPTYDDWLIDGRNCLKAKNEKDFIEKIELLKNDNKLLRKLKNESLKLAKNNDIDITAKKLIKEFKELI